MERVWAPSAAEATAGSMRRSGSVAPVSVLPILFLAGTPPRVGSLGHEIGEGRAAESEPVHTLREFQHFQGTSAAIPRPSKSVKSVSAPPPPQKQTLGQTRQQWRRRSQSARPGLRAKFAIR